LVLIFFYYRMRELRRMKQNLVSFSTQHFAATSLPIENQGREVLLNAYAYRGDSENEELLILVHRNEQAVDGTIPLVSLHQSCVPGDIFHSLRCDCYKRLRAALKSLCAAQFGALVYLPHNHVGNLSLVEKLRSQLPQGHDDGAVGANATGCAPIGARTYALVASAFHELGVHTIQLSSGDPAVVEALSACGLSIIARAPLMNAPA
jgi:GTP cyclohydrolase II/3,4-dihydroxy 2-butanone 4-phosphate synthase/GTP cyclohydrolase II